MSTHQFGANGMIGELEENRINGIQLRTFAGCYERINDYLCAIIEITELRFPYNQIVWIIDRHAIFERQNSLFR